MYITEGIPLGFAAVAIVTQMRRLGVSAAAIGAFVGAIYLPWAFKWAVGPIVDVFSSDRFGRRRTWIIAMQLGMVASLFVLQSVGLGADIKLLTTLIIVHNVFAATQDVAIDALAIGTLKADERGMAGGLTFAGAYLGQTSAVLAPFTWSSTSASATRTSSSQAPFSPLRLLVVLPLQEPIVTRVTAAGAGLQRMGAELRLFVRPGLGRIHRIARVTGGTCVCAAARRRDGAGSFAAQTLAVDLGFDDDRVASINLWTTMCQRSAASVGGWLSDRLGRRRSLAWFIFAMTPVTPVAGLDPVACRLDPPRRSRASRRCLVVPALVVTVFWLRSLLYCLATA